MARGEGKEGEGWGVGKDKWNEEDGWCFYAINKKTGKYSDFFDPDPSTWKDGDGL